MRNAEINISEVIIGVVINLVAGIIIYIFTTNVIYAIITVIGVSILVSLFYSRRPLIGLVKEYKTLYDGPKSSKVIDDITTGFRFMGISAKTLLIDDKFVRGMIQKARGACQFKFLIIHPNSKFVGEKAEEEGDTAIGWKNEIEATVHRL